MVIWKVQTIFPIWLCLLFLYVSCVKKRVVYTGYEAYRFPNTHDDVRTLKKLQDINPGLIFLRQVGTTRQPVDIMFAPHLQTDLLAGLKKKMKSTLLANDVEKILDHENNVNTLKIMANNNTFLFDTYWDHPTLRSFYQDLESTHPETCKIERYGTSSGPAQLPLEAVVVSLEQPAQSKPTLLVDGGTHSREWITVMGCANFLNEIVTKKQNFLAILKIFNFIFICSVNPEGFVYSWEVNRFWRKTRTPTSQPEPCVGVDPNRNYDFGYGGEGSSSNECDDTYRGTKPFSISETKSLRDYALTKDCRSYTSLHSYSQLLLLGYGCESGNVPNQIYPTFTSDKTMAKAAIDALRRVHGTSYQADNSDLILYQACGTGQDWFLANVADYAWTYELRDTGTFGFALPANQVKATCEETTASLTVLHQLMVQELLDRNMTKKDNGKLTDEK